MGHRASHTSGRLATGWLHVADQTGHRDLEAAATTDSLVSGLSARLIVMFLMCDDRRKMSFNCR